VLDLTGGVRARIDVALQSTLRTAIAAAAVGAAALFLLIALFIALAETYDVLVACLVLGAFVVAAAVAAVVSALAGRRPRTRRTASLGAPGLLAPRGEQAAAAASEFADAVSAGVKDVVRRRRL
jgi:hypothetical protein